MRLSKINPWSGAALASPRKVEEAAATRPKPPDADGGVSGAQAPPAAPSGGPAPDDAPSHAIDIRI